MSFQSLVYTSPESALAASFSTSFSNDGTKFAVASQEGVVVVWDVRSTKPLKVFESDKTRGSASGSWTTWPPNDSWDRPRFRVLAPGWGFRSVKFSPSGSGKEVMVFTEVIIDFDLITQINLIIIIFQAYLAGPCY
jgi:WD40 repeat protein